jgi:hypothetical protein
MITHKKLLSLLRYDRRTGLFTWKGDMYHKSRIGKIAGSVKVDGYVIITIAGKAYYAAPLARFYVTGKWPANTVDHVNRIRSDNRWANLREATYAQNSSNRKLVITNKSGYRGVSFAVKNGKWRASLKCAYKTINLGDWDTPEQAAMAYDLEAIERFGAFAHLNFPDREFRV